MLVASVIAGIAAWVGAASQHAGIGFGELLQAGLNVAPPALFVLGIGALAFGLWPRGAIGVAYGLVVWSFLAEIVASIIGSGHWLATPRRCCTSPRRRRRPRLDGRGVARRPGSARRARGLSAFGRRDLVGT